MDKKQSDKLPNWGLSKFIAFNNEDKYELFNPEKFVPIKGDFNGDGNNDLAIIISNKITNEIGVLVIHQNKKLDYVLFGSGNEIEEMRNLDWIGVFEKVNKGETVSETIV